MFLCRCHFSQRRFLESKGGRWKKKKKLRWSIKASLGIALFTCKNPLPNKHAHADGHSWHDGLKYNFLLLFAPLIVLASLSSRLLASHRARSLRVSLLPRLRRKRQIRLVSDLQRLMRVFALAYRYRYRSCNVNTDRLGNYVLLNSLFSSTFPKPRSHGVRDASGGDNSCYLLQLITRKPQTRWRTWSDSNARQVNTVKSSPAKQRGPRYETVHASSIKELDEGKQAKALMVIEIGFLRGCQLAHQDVRQHQAPGVKRGPPLQSVWLETVSLKHGGTGIRDLRGQDLDLRRVLVLLRCTSAFRSRTAGGRFEMPWKPIFPNYLFTVRNAVLLSWYQKNGSLTSRLPTACATNQLRKSLVRHRFVAALQRFGIEGTSGGNFKTQPF